jgi:predicted N-acetyltransferase YhbS
MQVALNRAELAGHGSVILVGDPEYYERFGFAADPARGLVMPGPFERRRMLGLELADGALRGAEGPIIGTGAAAPAWQLAA